MNTKHPGGAGGSLMLWLMNWGHGKLANWGLQYLTIKGNDRILDIGCGGGANISRMLKKAPNVQLAGIDPSELSVAKSIKYNKKAIDRKRCELKQGSVSGIPYKEAAFDTVTAFETIYFWPDIINDTKEVLRVLKPGGTFFICNEAVRLDLDNEKPPHEYFAKMLDLKIYSPQEFHDILTQSGFVDIKTNVSENKKRICVTAQKSGVRK